MKHLLTWAQISDYKERYKTNILLVMKICVAFACLWFIYSKVSFEEIKWETFSLGFSRPILMVFVIILMPFNWSLEAERWRVAVDEEPLTFRESISKILAGLALNWVVPFTLGDAGGRLIGVLNYQKSGIALVKNRMIMLVITVVFGAGSVMFYYQVLSLRAIGIFIIIIVAIALFLSNRLPKLILTKEIVILSLLRYLIFTIQFIVLLYLFLPELKYEVIIFGVGWIFLFRTIIPSLFGNFGVRESSAILYFEPHVADLNLVLIPCLLIWIINTVIPSIVGSYFVFNWKTNQSQKKPQSD